MNVMKTILNVLGVLAAIPVALMLAAWLICVPPTAAISDWTQPDVIKQMIRDVDYEALLGEEADDEFMLQVMETEAIAGVMDLFVDDLFAQFEGAPAGTVCTEQAVRDCVEAHMDELVAILRNMPAVDGNMDAAQLTDEEIIQYIRDSLYPDIPELLENLPKIEDLCAEMETDVQTARLAVQMLRDGLMLKSCIALAVVLSLLLFVLRLYRLRGFIWLSVVYFLDAGFVFLLGKGVKLAALEMPAEELSMMKPVLEPVVEKMETGSVVYVVVAVVCVVTAVLFHNYLVKRSMPRPENMGPELY